MRTCPLLSIFLALAALLGPAPARAAEERPNVLWIVSEDNSPLLGCYGDEYATTPNLDRLASRSILFENAFATAPVCAAARSTLISGMYACSLGTENMRSRYRLPDAFKMYPQLLHEAGYYCGNHSKTDYNISNVPGDLWQAGKKFPGFAKLKGDQPFFSIVNITTSHESSMHKKAGETNHDPDTAPLPPYHPDTPEMRRGWAQYYDVLEKLDGQIGDLLQQLAASGMAEKTIVFYYSDHGGTLARSKRFLYNSGTHVPLLVHVPPKFQGLVKGKMGTRTDRLVTFVDLPPTLLSLAGVPIPDNWQGQAFLGPQATAPRDYAYMHRARMDERYDLSRSLRDKQFRYTRNYMPHRPYGMHLEYLWRAEPTRAWEREFKAGRCNAAQSAFWQRKPFEELYDVTKDPHEVHNLTDDPQHAQTLARMRKACDAWQTDIRDAGFIPEGLVSQISESEPPFEWKQSDDNYPFQRVLALAATAAAGDRKKLPQLTAALADPNPVIRFWGAMGCVNLGEAAGPAAEALQALLEDEIPDVAVTAAEALAVMGRTMESLPVLQQELAESRNEWASLRALNVLDELDDVARPAIPALERAMKKAPNKYIPRTANHVLNQLRGTDKRVD